MREQAVDVDSKNIRRVKAEKEKEAFFNFFASQRVSYPADFINVFGSHQAAVFLSQLIYWHGKGSDKEGWIYKTQAELEAEIGLTRRQQDAVRKRFRNAHLIEEKFSGIPRRLYFRLKMDNLFAVAAQWKESKDAKTIQAVTSIRDPADLSAPPRKTGSINKKRNKNNLMYVSSSMETPKSDNEERNENNIMYVSSHIDVTKRTSSKRQNVQAITEITHETTTNFSLLVPSDKPEPQTLGPTLPKTEREFSPDEYRARIIEKAKSVFRADSTISKIDIQTLDYLLYLVETGQKDPNSIRHLYAYCKSFAIPDSFPRFHERHLPEQARKGYSRESFNNDHPRSQEYALVDGLKSRYPRVDVEAEIQKMRDGNIAYPDSPDDALEFLTAWMAKVKEQNDMAAEAGLAQIRRICNYSAHFSE
jgi:hypothetical protein